MAGLLERLYQWKAQAQEGAMRPILESRYNQAMQATGYAPRPDMQMEMPGGGQAIIPGTEGSGFLRNPENHQVALDYANRMKSIPGYADVGNAVAAQALSQFSPEAIQAQNQAQRVAQFTKNINPNASRQELAYAALYAPTDSLAGRIQNYADVADPAPAQMPWYIADGQIDPRALAYQRAGASQTAVNMPGLPDKYAETYLENEAKADIEFSKQMDSDIATAQKNRYTFGRMEALLNEGVKTGAAEPAKLAVRRWAAAAGIEVDPTTNPEEFNRLSNELAFARLSEFKGATSEKELSFSKDLVGNLGTDEGALRRYLIVGNRLADRVDEQQRVYETYLQEHKNDRGFRAYWRKYQLDNPLIHTPKKPSDMDKVKPGDIYVHPGTGKLMMRPLK